MAPPDLIVWDECHHRAAASWAKVFDAFPRARHIGLSATPQRLSGEGLDRFFQHMVCGPQTRELIEQGYLSPYRLFAPKGGGPDHSTMRSKRGDLDCEEVMSKPKVTGDAISDYIKRARGRQALLFHYSIPESEKAAERLRDAGVRAAHVDGTTDDATRKNAIRDLEAGALDVLCNVELFGEGVSVNNVSCIIQLRPTKSLSLHLQQIGRGLRMYPGKKDCIILDHAGNAYDPNLGLPDDDREWSLEGRPASKKERDPDDVLIRQCKSCGAISRAFMSTCRECGAAFLQKPRTVAQVEGELEEVDPAVARAARVQEERAAGKTLEGLQALAQQRGYKPGWATHRWEAIQKYRRRA
jgi:DNA repair protein RadD